MLLLGQGGTQASREAPAHAPSVRVDGPGIGAARLCGFSERCTIGYF